MKREINFTDPCCQSVSMAFPSLILLLLTLVITSEAYGQQLFDYSSNSRIAAGQLEAANGFPNSLDDRYQLNEKAVAKVSQIISQPFVEEAHMVSIDLANLNHALTSGSSLTLNLPSQSIPLQIYLVEKHSSGLISAFAERENDRKFSMILDGDKLYMELLLEGSSYSLFPIENSSLHTIVRFERKAPDNVICMSNEMEQSSLLREEAETPEFIAASDDNCNARIMMLYSSQAAAALPMNLEMFNQARLNELNLSFANSGVDMKFELAYSTVINFVEDGGRDPGDTSKAFDLVQLRNGTGPFIEVPALRWNFKADIVMLITENSVSLNPGTNTLGQVYRVNASKDNAYAFTGLEGINLNYLTFSHEMGHLQGCRHHDDPGDPDYARGHVSAAGGPQTIHGVDCLACREQQFSNPNLTYPGTLDTAGTDTRDNARRLNEQANRVRNIHKNFGNFFDSDFTVDSNSEANYYANNFIRLHSNVVFDEKSRVSVRAPFWITLGNGFTIEEDAEVLFFNDDCTTITLRESSDMAAAGEQNNPAQEITPDSPPISAFDLSEIQSSEELLLDIHPNPFNQDIQLSAFAPEDGQLEIQISNMTGEIVYRTARIVPAGYSHIGIEIPDLPMGMYLCTTHYLPNKGASPETNKQLLYKH